MAYQIAGSTGFGSFTLRGRMRSVRPHPRRTCCVELLAIPAKENLATLILIDEVLMYARGKIGHDAIWRERLVDFFQYLTQAATKGRRCAIVASLLATEPKT